MTLYACLNLIVYWYLQQPMDRVMRENIDAAGGEGDILYGRHLR